MKQKPAFCWLHSRGFQARFWPQFASFSDCEGLICYLSQPSIRSNNPQVSGVSIIILLLQIKFRGSLISDRKNETCLILMIQGQTASNRMSAIANESKQSQRHQLVFALFVQFPL